MRNRYVGKRRFATAQHRVSVRHVIACPFEKVFQNCFVLVTELPQRGIRAFLLTVYKKRVTSYRQSIGALMRSPQFDLLQGTLDVLILKSLALQELHGMGISRRISQMTNGAFEVKPGSLFPALHRMEDAGWLTSTWGESETNRRAKFYSLTKAGKKQLQSETERWERISLAMAAALETS
jgi:PadR family transcriptional regulator, regulatory protein PadR